MDLAGSERLNAANGGVATGNATAFQEPFNPINSGLLALSNVTAALGDPRRKASHVPYWDSKLTYILKVFEILLPFREQGNTVTMTFSTCRIHWEAMHLLYLLFAFPLPPPIWKKI